MTTPTVASKNQVLHSTDGLVDLLVVDCTNRGGSVYYLSPQVYGDHSLISFGGQVYNFCPFALTGFEVKTLATDLPRPTLAISNANKLLLAPVVSLGDITGATITYTATYGSYLDAGANPDGTKYASRGKWRIASKPLETNQQMQFELASPLDMPGMMYPPRQYLVYPGINPPDGIYFPGIQPFRTDQMQSQ